MRAWWSYCLTVPLVLPNAAAMSAFERPAVDSASMISRSVDSLILLITIRASSRSIVLSSTRSPRFGDVNAREPATPVSRFHMPLSWIDAVLEKFPGLGMREARIGKPYSRIDTERHSAGTSFEAVDEDPGFSAAGADTNTEAAVSVFPNLVSPILRLQPRDASVGESHLALVSLLPATHYLLWVAKCMKQAEQSRNEKVP